jgi:ABC-type Fe3+/spermidine/putrescine transport system ATPase subunit
LVEVRLRSVSNFILRNVSDSFPSEKLSVIMGPNGAGKTTLLRVIAGVEEYDGEVLFDGCPVDSIPPYLRRVSYVPQKNSLFKNMKVYDNIAYGPRVRGYSREEVRRIVQRLAEMFKLEELLHRYPHSLSGGEARRVALARALAVDPEILLLDEPLSGLDAEASALFKQELMMAIGKLKKTVILVTHTARNLLHKASHLTILWSGVNVFSGRPSKIGEAQLPEEVLHWLGTVVKVDYMEMVNDTPIAYIGNHSVPLITASDASSVYHVIIPPDAVKICRKGREAAKVLDVTRAGPYFKAKLKLIDSDIKVYTTTPAPLSKGEVTKLRFLYAIPLS